MNEMQFYDAMREGLWVAARMSVPLLGVALITGIGIGLFQALTSIQEMTLTFVPKLAAIIAVFWVSMSMMTDMLRGYFTDAVIPRVMGL